MTEISAFKVSIGDDVDRPGRYRWDVSVDGKVRDKSVYSYESKREAQADADCFVQKLNITWRIH